MGWLFGEPGYQPTARDLYLERRQAGRDANRDRARDQAEAQRIQDQIRKDEIAAAEKARVAAEKAAQAIRADAQAEEKRLLTDDVTRYTGATSKLTGPLFVWHWKAEPPAAVQRRMGVEPRSGYGPIIALRAGGGIRRSDLLVDAIEGSSVELTGDAAIWSSRTRVITDDVLAAYPILGVLRNDELMAELLGNAGVNDVSTSPEPVQGYYGTYTRRVTLVTVPTLTDVSIERDGLALTFAHMAGVTAGDWAKKSERLISEFARRGLRAPNMTALPTDDGGVRLRFRDSDPLADPLPQGVREYDADASTVPLGMAADGSTVNLKLAGNPNTLFAGLTRGGKTASMQTALAALAGHVEIHIFDCAGSGEWSVFEPVCASYASTRDVSGVATLLDSVLAAFESRMKTITDMGEVNFWDIPRARREAAGLFPVVVVLEEAHRALRKLPASDDGAKANILNRARQEDASATVGKSGIVFWIATQKPKDDLFPMDVNDQFTQRVAFRLDTDTAARCALGEAASARPNPQQDIQPGQQGRFVARVDDRGNLLGQAYYAPIRAIREHIDGVGRKVPLQLGARVERTDNGAIPMPAPTETKTAPAANADGDDW